MKHIRLLLVTLLAIIGFSSVGAQDKEAYAVLTDNGTDGGKTLTFYYNASKPEGAYSMSWSAFPDWTNNGSGNKDITAVTFDKSFEGYDGLTSTQNMFRGCKNLKTINHLENLNTSKVTTMYHMFAHCEALTSLDLSNFNTSQVYSMSAMFSNCYALTSLDLSNFNTSSVTSMSYMFVGCEALTSLDLSNFNTAKVTSMNSMFEYCRALETIYCPKGTDWSRNSASKTNMFEYCTELSGKCGSWEFGFNPNSTDGTYAKVCTNNQNGYFTYKGYIGYTLEVTDAGMATLFLDFDAQIPSGVEAVYYCKGLDDDEAVPTTDKTHAVQISSSQLIPAKTGVFVKASKGKYKFEDPQSGSYSLATIEDNILEGTSKEKTVDSHSVLTLGYGKKNETLGFWWYTGTTIPANRAYIPGEALEAGVKGITLVFDEETGISLTPNPSPQGEGSWYSIDGRKLEGKPTQKGLYINNGKKVLIQR